MANTIKFRQRCKPCHGTGLYRGMGELAGAAVVCHTCKGGGYKDITITYETFEGRIDPPSEVLYVYGTNPGIAVDGNGSVPGGVPITAWLADPDAPAQPGTEMREHTCPAWWYQSIDSDKKPAWDDDDRKCGWGQFSSCAFFTEKAGCWARWDRENAQ